jgi:hypothetical protein
MAAGPGHWDCGDSAAWLDDDPAAWFDPYTDDPPKPRADECLVYRHEMRLRQMRASVTESARLIDEQLAASGFRFKAAMLTLTYREDVAYSRRQISRLVTHVRKWLQRRGAPFVAYVWVMELTQRGRPHYHLLVWLPKGLTLPKPDKQGWWPWGHTRIEWARSALGYLVKYASKAQGQGAEATIPKGARLSGNGGLDTLRRRVRRWRLLPQWVREAFTFEDDPRRAEGGGFVSRRTGEIRGSPYVLVNHAPSWVWCLFARKGAT